jgi:type IV pilus assembly protein PilB
MKIRIKEKIKFGYRDMEPLNKISKKQLGELLIERGIINHRQLEKALIVQKEKGGLIGEILVELGFAKEEDIAQALTCQYGFPYLPLTNYEIDVDVIKVVPKNVAVQYCLIPIDKIGKSLTLAMANPLNLQAIEDVELVSGCTIQTFVSTATDIRKAIEKYYKGKK